MSASTQPTDFSDLYNSLIKRARVDATQTINVTQAKELINTALYDIALGNGEKFPWLERHARVLLQAPYITGTVSISQGSATLTGSGTLWATTSSFGVANAREGGKVLLPGDDTIYEVQSVDSDTQITLSGVFLGATIAAETYTYFEDEYALAADFLKPIDKTRFGAQGNIEIIDRREFRRLFTSGAASTGRVVCCAIFDKARDGSTAPVRRVRFWRPPADTQYIPYSYVTRNVGVTAAGVEQDSLSGDTDEPLAPLYARHLIVLKALEHWYRDKKNDSRSQEVKAEYVDGVTRLLADVEVGAQRPSLSPRVGTYHRRAKTPYRGGRSRSHVIGTSFDEILE